MRVAGSNNFQPNNFQFCNFQFDNFQANNLKSRNFQLGLMLVTALLFSCCPQRARPIRPSSNRPAAATLFGCAAPKFRMSIA